MVRINFKDGVVVELHDDMTFDIVECGDEDVDFNFHYAMSLSTQASFINDVSSHEEALFENINRRLGGVLTS